MTSINAVSEANRRLCSVLRILKSVSMRHKYLYTYKNRTKDSSSVFCIKCGLVRQFVAGRATYFIDDNIHLKAPKCDQRLIKNQNS